ncbi:hypothetical protein JVU11DRAFT_7309 [Chiua virens]|nr:hypothetical protein JVU11DRAFT_7309 [Chiua virens]
MKSTSSIPNSTLGNPSSVVEQGNVHQSPSDSQAVVATSARPKTQRAPKESLKAMINKATKTINTTTVSYTRLDKEPNLSQYLK